jgi:hypothetical protein
MPRSPRRSGGRCGTTTCDLAQAHITELDRKIVDLQRMRASLGALVATCERPRADRSCPLLATLESDIPLTEVPR